MAGPMPRPGDPGALSCRHCGKPKVIVEGFRLCRRCDAPVAVGGVRVQPTWAKKCS